VKSTYKSPVTRMMVVAGLFFDPKSDRHAAVSRLFVAGIQKQFSLER
jgi:hypothetical protein